jgi:hypothetical protein
MKNMGSGRVQVQQTRLSVIQDENWSTINGALNHGCRRLPGNDSIAKLLERNGRKTNLLNQHNLTEDIILEACDKYNTITGKWPIAITKDLVPGLPNETWKSIESALRYGYRGLLGKCSLAKLLHKNGRKLNKREQSLDENYILTACDKYYKKNGMWPTQRTKDPVPGLSGESWKNIQQALRSGLRGLPGNSSLAQLLDEGGRRVNHLAQPPLTKDIIINACNEYYNLTNKWPTQITKDPVPGLPNNTWRSVDACLRVGSRGLLGGTSLSKLLKKYGKK